MGNIRDIVRPAVRPAVHPVNSKYFSWNAYFSSRDIGVHITGRSGLSLPDEFGNDGSILLPYVSMPDGDEYLKLVDSGALDIAANNKFTFYQWVKGEDETGGALRYFGGKLAAGNVNGRYGFWCNTDNKLACQAQPTGGAQLIYSETLITDCVPHLLMMEINQTALTITFYVDNVQIGDPAAYTGTFSAMASQYEFYINAGSNSAGSAVSYISKASYSDCGIILDILTTAQKTALYNRTLQIAHKAHWTCGGTGEYWLYEPDLSGNSYHLTGTNLSTSDFLYSSFGSRHCLNVGYTHYNSGDGDIYIPYSDAGAELTYTDIPDGTVKVLAHEGDSDYHNLANSIIYIPFSTWDRSDTDNFEDYARAENTYYDDTDSTTKKYWHISEINNLLFNAWGKDNHKGHNFVLVDDYSYKSRKTLKEILSFETNISGTAYSKIISEYCNDYVYSDTYEDDYIYWKYDSQNIIVARGDRVLKHDSGTIYLSVDGGVTFPYSNEVADFDEPQFGYICANGDIAFASKTKFYRSANNLTTVTEITAEDVAGDPYSPSVKDNWGQIGTASFMDTAIGDPIVWGNYSVYEGIEDDNINLWYTIDNFATVKSFYKFRVSEPDLGTNHIHNAQKTSENHYLVHTGDGNGDETNIHWLDCEYTPGTDSWAVTALYTDVKLSKYFASGIGFAGGYCYWCTDGLDYGIHKVVEEDLGDTGEFENIYPTSDPSVFLLLEPDGEAIATLVNAKNEVLSTNDTFATINRSRIFGMPANVGFWTSRAKNTNGWFLVRVSSGTFPYYSSSAVWIKIK